MPPPRVGRISAAFLPDTTAIGRFDSRLRADPDWHRNFTAASPARNTPILGCLRLVTVSVVSNNACAYVVSQCSTSLRTADDGHPADLRLWLGEDRLLYLTLEAAAERADAAAGSRDFRHGNQSFPVPQLLALTAFCYLTGRFGSEEIEDELESDAALRYLCAGHFPSSTLLRHFRRVHRDAIGEVLRDLLRAAINQRTSQAWLAASANDGADDPGCEREWSRGQVPITPRRG